MTYWFLRNKLDVQLRSYSDFFHLIPDYESRNKMLEEMVKMKAKILMIDNMTEYDATSEVPIFIDTKQSLLSELDYLKCAEDIRKSHSLKNSSRN